MSKKRTHTTLVIKEDTEAEVQATLEALSKERARLEAKRTCFYNQKMTAKARSLAHLSRDLRLLCTMQRQGKVTKQEILDLIHFLGGESGPDYVSLDGRRLDACIETELEEIEDCFGIGFLDLTNCSLHFFAYHDNDAEIAKWENNANAIQIFAK